MIANQAGKSSEMVSIVKILIKVFLQKKVDYQ